MNKRRLLKLAGLLEADAKNKKGIRFDLSTWGFIDGKKPLSCGTTACAMGLAAISGAFKRAGLSYRIGRGSTAIRITFNGRNEPLRAAEKTFGLSQTEATWLFIPDNYPVYSQIEGSEGERMVAKRIRDFVAGKATP